MVHPRRVYAAIGWAALAGGALLLGRAARPTTLSSAPPSSRPLLPLLPSSALALTAAFLICVLASAAGIGGGAALVPLYLTLGGQSTHSAVALSNFTIVGSALAAFAINARRVHVPPGPDALPRPLIDWDVILLMEPATIVGAMCGALLNAVTPPWLTLFGLTLLLALVTHSVAGRARGAWVAESVALERARAVALEEQAGGGGSLEAGSSLTTALLVAGGEEAGAEDIEGEGGARRPKPPASEQRVHGGGSSGASPKPLAAALGLAEGDRAGPPPPPPSPSPPCLGPRLPAAKAGPLLVALFAAVAACDNLKARLPCGSLPYWLTSLGVIPPAVGLTVWARRQLLGAAAGAAASGGGVDVAGSGVAEEQHADPPSTTAQRAWTPLNTLAIPGVAVLAGLAAGMFGVGGGIIKGPFLILIARLPPEVAAASAMTMILFTSATAFLVYWGAGATRQDWGGAAFGVGLAGSALGVVGLARAVAATGGRRSLVTITMAVTLGLSLLATAWQAGVAVRGREGVGRGSLC